MNKNGSKEKPIPILKITAKRLVNYKDKRAYEVILKDIFGRKHTIELDTNLTKSGIIGDKELKRLNQVLDERINLLANTIAKSSGIQDRMI